MPPIATIINILAALVAVLNFLVAQPFIPPEILPFLLFGVVVLNGVIDLLRVLFPQNALVLRFVAPLRK